MTDATELLRSLLTRAQTITRDTRLRQIGEGGDVYYSPLMKEALFLALDIQQLDQQLRAGGRLPEPWVPHPAGGTR
jgi:hypothetical protein